MSDPLFDKIEQSQKLLGWCTYRKARTLAALVLALRPKITVEVGIFQGRSLIPMALAQREVGDGIVWGIDSWEPLASIECQKPADVVWWRSVNYANVEQGFRKYVHEAGLDNVVKIIKEKSDDVEPPIGIGLLHIDGNHSAKSISDAKRFGERVKPGGICVVDDLGWVGADSKGPAHAMETLKGLGFQELYRVCNKETGGQDDWAVMMRL